MVIYSGRASIVVCVVCLIVGRRSTKLGFQFGKDGVIAQSRRVQTILQHVRLGVDRLATCSVCHPHPRRQSFVRRVRRLDQLRGGCFCRRQQRHNDDLGRWHHRFQKRNDPCERHRGVIAHVIQIVDADEETHHPWLVLWDFPAFGQSPCQLFDMIATNAQCESLFREKLCKRRLLFWIFVNECCDGIAVQDTVQRTGRVGSDLSDVPSVLDRSYAATQR